jgi:ABC-type Na+ transport system ATPase subunit NatA
MSNQDTNPGKNTEQGTGSSPDLAQPSTPDLRKRIVDSIRRSGLPCWLTFKANTFGFAGFIDFQTEKMYIEVLFYPEGHPSYPLSISMNSTVLPVKEIVADIEANLVHDGNFVDVYRVLERVDRFRLAYIDNAKELLNKERGLLEGEFETLPGTEAFHQDVLLHVKDGLHVIAVDYHRYPVAPVLSIPASLLEHLGIEDPAGLASMKTWESTGNLHVVDVLDEIASRAWNGDATLAKQYQVLSVDAIDLPGKDKKISFTLPRGRVAGIFVEGVPASDVLSRLGSIASSDTGNVPMTGGRMAIFSSPITSKEACVVDATLPENDAGVSIQEIIKACWSPRPTGIIQAHQAMKKLITSCGLALITREKPSTLMKMDKVKVNIAKHVARGRRVFFIDFNAIGITRLEQAMYQNVMHATARAYHAIFIFSGPDALVSLADQIITISVDRDVTNASLEQYQARVAGDVITLQVKNPPAGLTKTLKDLSGSPVIEEIMSERYKIYAKDDAKTLMVKIFSTLGSCVYKLSINPPRIEDYMQFVQLEH